MALTAEVFAGSKVRASTFNESGLPVVSSPSDISLPFTGQTIFCTADNMIYRYTGAAWLAIVATGGSTAATMHEARYHQIASAQSINSSADTKMKFEQSIYTCNDVVASGVGNTDFQLQRDGVWGVGAGVRYLGNAGGGERHIWIQSGTTFVTANRQVGDTAVNVGSAPVTLSTYTEIRALAGSSICVGLWQNSTATISIDIGFGGTCHVVLTWLRPL